MSERTACLYASLPSAEHLDQLAAPLRALGVSLADPDTGAVVAIDEEGEPTLVPEAEFRAGLARSPETRFLWRFGPGDRRYCRVRQAGHVSVVEFALEGYAEAESRTLRDALEAHFVTRPGSALGFVFDPDGATEGVDWDDFFLLGGRLSAADCPDGPPERLGLLGREVGRLGSVVSSVEARSYGELVVLRR
jgi:hypothetical protein